MKRTRIQLDDATHEAVRRQTLEPRRSMASVVRETLSEALGTRSAPPPRSVEELTFVGLGSDPNPPADIPASEDHDRWYAEAVAHRFEQATRREPASRSGSGTPALNSRPICSRGLPATAPLRCSEMPDAFASWTTR